MSRSANKAAAQAWIRTLLSARGPDGAPERRLPPAAEGGAVDRLFRRGAPPDDGRRARSSCSCPIVAVFLRVPPGELSRRSGARRRSTRSGSRRDELDRDGAHPRLRDAGRLLDRDAAAAACATSSSRSSSSRSCCRRRSPGSGSSPRSAARACSAGRSRPSGSTSHSRRWRSSSRSTFVASPFYVRTAIAAFEAVDRRSCGGPNPRRGPGRVFFRVVLPLAARRSRRGRGAGVRARHRRVRRHDHVRRLAPGRDADALARDLRAVRPRLRRRARDQRPARPRQRALLLVRQARDQMALRVRFTHPLRSSSRQPS